MGENNEELHEELEITEEFNSNIDLAEAIDQSINNYELVKKVKDVDYDLAVIEEFLEQNKNLKLSEGLSTRQGKYIGDDYPVSWKNPPEQIDRWGYFTGHCTSFVANRLHNVNKFEMPRPIGHAGQWGDSARRLGYRVDKIPAIGSVAYFTDGSYGHVAWVAGIIRDRKY